jgi:regulator of replication initiation timing
MFAVREEVEVLKEKINELMDRINQLEVENTILKANASQETLSQLTTATTIVVSPQAQSQIQTSPAQPQSLQPLSKINIDPSVLQVNNITGSLPNPTPQNPPTTS